MTYYLFNQQSKELLMIHSIAQSVLLSIVFLVGLSGLGLAASSPEPLEQLRPHIETIVTILGEDEGADKVDRIMAVVRQGFDFREIAKRVLGKKWRTLSPAEKEEFVELFTELLKYAYITQMDRYSDQQVEFGKQRIKGKRALVETVVIDGAREIPVSYIMLLRGDQWKVYDIVIEGVSLICNYLEQFREILKNDKYRGLTLLIQQKIAEYVKRGATG